MNIPRQNLIIVITLALILTVSQKTFAADPSIPANFSPGAYNAGTINTHDIDLIKQRQFQKQEQADFTEYKKKKENQNQQDKSNSQSTQTDQTSPVIKAKVSEYQTKGVYIEKVNFSESLILSQEELNTFAQELENNNVFIEDIQEVIREINNLYAAKGYVTARAFLIPQTMDDGNLFIELVEGKIGSISINETKWTRDYYVKQRLSQKQGDVFDIISLEQDILKFNRYNDGIKLKANLFPGTEEKTTDIQLVAREEFPFHMTTLMDNAGRETIGILRGGLMLQNDSLFGLRDRLTLGAYQSRSSITPFADYNIPVNKYDGRVGFSYSSSNTAITSGSYEMFNIKSRSYNYSLYYLHPLIRKPNFELNGIVSGNYKQATTSFDGYDLDTDKITSAQVGLNAKYDMQKSILYASQSVYHAFPIIKRESKYFKYEGNFVTLHDFGHGIVGQYRINYQYVPQDVIPYMDQFQSGGISTVRGYSEGLLIGKSGYFTSAELLFPLAPSSITVNKDNKKTKVPFFGRWVKGVCFVDNAGVFPFKGSGPGQEGITANDFLVSGGLGLRISLPGDFTARLYWGFPFIRNNHETRQRIGRFHFELAMTPDFYSLMQLKKSKQEKKELELVNKKLKKEEKQKELQVKNQKV